MGRVDGASAAKPRRGLHQTAATLFVALCGCTAKPNLAAIGTSNGGAPATATSLADGGAAVSVPLVSPIPNDFRTSMARVNATRFVSKGHAGGRWEADVYGTPGALATLRVDRGAVPVGTRFIEEQFERGDAGAGPLFMMEKKSAGFDSARGDWRYVAVGASGEVAGDGAIESCAGCHGDAPHDHLFRVSDSAP
jgi:hypothetical protein